MKRLLNPKVLVAVVLVLGAMVISKMYFPVPLPGIQLPAEGVPILGFRVPNTLIHTILADITLILFAVLATRNMKDIPDGLQNFAEWVIEGFYSITEDIAGDRARQWFPIIMTIFLLVIVANWWELVPGVDSVGVVEAPHGNKGYVLEKLGPFYVVTNEEVIVEHHGEEAHGEEGHGEEAKGEEHHELPTTEDGRPYGVLVPFLRASATDLNFTLALAVISMVLVQYYGVQALGMSYFSKFLNFKGGIMGFLVGLIETVSEFAKIISFAFRLFGNIFAGQVLLFIMAFLVPWLLPVPFFGLELFVGFIQAFVFAMLTLVFFASAVEAHDEHH
ncbi:F-type H+-transporting ATPase subunit a [Ardenticatena maritima]|uniref:ATP synthase subunit a n=2 Tax=Ardenticatena maritima TaxID=872965 RepID=A0A0M8KAY3_9CHLR|nr:F0F1 ATP synthase subunit A [Ardenticatena maritima]GAP64029.1 F-type H+-transporting ATPase subunit a [Ardenticatena maritima]